MKRWRLIIYSAAMLAGVLPLSAYALQSANYEIDESVIGGGGLVNENSASYSLGENIGDVATGESSSSNYNFQSGFTTTADPTLSFSITASSVNFGTFSAGQAATATSTFSVSNYTSYGYVVQMIGSPPSHASHTLAALSSTTPSQVGTEQYGINLVANTSPTTFGANPNNGGFGYGVAAANYNTANNYRYVSGETIASAPKSSGKTDYTISYIINVSTLTPGGQYSGAQTLVCTGTY